MTIFLRVLDVDVGEKDKSLKAAVLAARGELATAELNVARYFEQDSRAFKVIPGSPFVYWAPDSIRNLFGRFPPLGSGARHLRQGLASADDFRFVRCAWEVSAESRGRKWIEFAKGGGRSPLYADVWLCINWGGKGAEIKSNVSANDKIRSNVWMLRDTEARFFMQPGLAWPRRPHLVGSFQFLPRGCIFGDVSPVCFAPDVECIAAVANSGVFLSLLGLLMGRGTAGGQTLQYEVGYVASVPVPDMTPIVSRRLAVLARRIWGVRRKMDSSNEVSRAFVLPRCMSARTNMGSSTKTFEEFKFLELELNEVVLGAYGLSRDDWVSLKAFGVEAAERDERMSDEPAESELSEASASEGVALLSWLVGVAFGRFDSRLATGERAIPPEPEPFDPLPSRSPGMYPEGEEPADRPDILVDDEGHSDDLAARAVAIAERVKFDAPENLRAWLAKEFFPLHIKMYSKSRRKAPIYWQLATPSASYSVWLYIHAFSKDTLFRVQNDYVAPKLAHEERRLESLTSELRDGATVAQRKQLAAQEAVVDELRAFLDEVKRVAPLWKPNLDDGVIINFAPLWRLVPQNKSWQKELKSTWDALCEGKYDWAHLAMHLWPERVVPKCAKDRSLAIAHGLEDVFWVEGTDGKWTARKTPTRSVDELVRERTSLAVKSALKSLLEAPAAAGKSGGRRGGGRRKSAAATEGGEA